jgi:hypothetical protein
VAGTSHIKKKIPPDIKGYVTILFEEEDQNRQKRSPATAEGERV